MFVGVYAMNIAQRFQTIREQKKISVYRLSILSEISETHIHKIEKGISQPSIYILEKLLSCMGVTLVEFFNNDAEIYYLNDLEKELICQFRSLTKEQSRAIVELIKQMNISK